MKNNSPIFIHIQAQTMGLVVLLRAVMIKQIRTKEREKESLIRIDFTYMIFSEGKKERERKTNDKSVC